MSGWRDRVAVVLAVLSAVAACTAVVAGYVGNALLDSEQFASRSAAALEEPAVRDFLGSKIADGAISRNPDLVAVRPLIESAAASVVGSSAFRGLYRSAVHDAHRAVIERDQDTVVLTLADVGTVLRAAVAKLDPRIAAKVDGDVDAQVVDDDISARIADGARRVNDVSSLGTALAVLALLLAGAAARLSTNRRRTVLHLSIALAVGALMMIAALGVARGAAVGQIGDTSARAAAQALWTSLLGDLRTVLLLFALAGTIAAAAARSLLRPVGLEQPLRRAWSFVLSTPEGIAARVARALALIAAGVFVLVDPGTAIELVAIGAGLLLVVAGSSELLRLGADPTREAQRGGRAAPAAARARRAPMRFIVAGLVAVGLVAVASAISARDGGVTAPSPPIERCNGHAELCDLPFNDVALAGTHNAMSAVTNPGWLFAQQDKGFPDQLRDGIRALLIDTHYGRPAGGRVKTDLGDITSADRAKGMSVN